MVPDSFYNLGVEERFLMMLTIDQRSTPEQRKRFSASIRRMHYEDFLRTAYWRTIRDYVVMQRQGKCVECLSSPATEVHHRSYDHHGQEHLHLADLMPVCRLCHEILQEKFDGRPAHFIENGIERVKSAGLAIAEWMRISEKLGRL